MPVPKKLIERGTYAVHTITDCIVFHKLFKQENADGKIARVVKKELFSVLRDNSIDCSLKYALSDAFIRFAMNEESTDCQEEILALLVLQQFERPEIFKVSDIKTNKTVNKAAYPH